MILTLSVTLAAILFRMTETFWSMVREGRIQSQHECQISEGSSEADLQTHFRTCTKNPGHSDFIPFNKFSLKHLPEDHREKDFYEFIKAQGDLTVRIGVNMVSTERPEFWPNTNVPYPFSNIKGKISLRSGTGEISVFKFIDGCGYNEDGDNFDVDEIKYKTKYKTCPCEKCLNSDKPNTTWWEILVTTAAHVVFDDIEARHTRCRLFFNEQDSPVVIIDKFIVVGVNIERDVCTLKYITCEPLGNQLFEKDKRKVELWKKLKNNYRNKLNDNLCFIVSHPHGCSKHVSIDQWIQKEKIGEYDTYLDKTQLTYKTSTCPGSSGARVHCVGYYAFHTHTGTNELKYNYSKSGIFEKESF